MHLLHYHNTSYWNVRCPNLILSIFSPYFWCPYTIVFVLSLPWIYPPLPKTATFTLVACGKTIRVELACLTNCYCTVVAVINRHHHVWQLGNKDQGQHHSCHEPPSSHGAGRETTLVWKSSWWSCNAARSSYWLLIGLAANNPFFCSYCCCCYRPMGLFIIMMMTRRRKDNKYNN